MPLKREVESGKPKSQALAMALHMAKKKMAQGGWVEKENVGHSDEHHFGNKSDSEAEPMETELQGKGFTEENLGPDNDKYDVQPGKFAEGGEVHPMDMMFREKFLNAKKMAYGDEVEADTAEGTKPYGENEEENHQLEIANEDLSGPAKHEAGDEDEDRLMFARSYLTRKAMRS